MPRKRTNNNLTEAERAAKNAYQREWAKKKRERLAASQASTTNILQEAVQAGPNYKALYEEECRKNAVLEAKVAELDKICKSFAEKHGQAQSAIQKSTIEYNARIKYMLDTVKHAYMSMQFAAAAADQGGNK